MFVATPEGLWRGGGMNTHRTTQVIAADLEALSAVYRVSIRLSGTGQASVAGTSGGLGDLSKSRANGAASGVQICLSRLDLGQMAIGRCSCCASTNKTNC